jgi:hypothetical protein
MTATAHKIEPTDAGNSAAALNFDVLVSTNAGLPLMNWTDLGPATSLGGGLYEFTDPGAIGQPQRFYRLVSP